jgi:hypothetical protein
MPALPSRNWPDHARTGRTAPYPATPRTHYIRLIPGPNTAKEQEAIMKTRTKNYTLHRTARLTYQVRTPEGRMAGYLKRSNRTGERGGAVRVWNGWMLYPDNHKYLQVVKDHAGGQEYAAQVVVQEFQTRARALTKKTPW